jgi:hypothetical protein
MDYITLGVADMPALQPDRSDKRRQAALRPIGSGDLWLASAAVAGVAPDWTVELSAIFPDDASLVIMPDGADDLIGPTFIVYQDENAYRLDQFQWDVLTGLDTYTSLQDALKALVDRLARLEANPAARSTLRH